jgi:hypothetical protein
LAKTARLAPTASRAAPTNIPRRNHRVPPIARQEGKIGVGSGRGKKQRKNRSAPVCFGSMRGVGVAAARK